MGLVISDNASDVTGIEITGALKNELAIAAGIVEGMNLGNNSTAALVAQGCCEIRWLATKVFYFSVHYFICKQIVILMKIERENNITFSDVLICVHMTLFSD